MAATRIVSASRAKNREGRLGFGARRGYHPGRRHLPGLRARPGIDRRAAGGALEARRCIARRDPEAGLSKGNGMIEIPRAERLIVALDVPTPAEARALAEKLGDAAKFYKVGLELFMAGGYFELIEWLTARASKVFVDLKFFDVPETV